MPLSRNEGCLLEVELQENGDLIVNMQGQDVNGTYHKVSAQIPNPVNGGGNVDDYKTLTKIYESMGVI